MKVTLFLIATVVALQGDLSPASALMAVFKKFGTDTGLTKEQVEDAIEAKDSRGQPLPVPPKDVLYKDVDKNGDGFLSIDEIKQWQGYQGRTCKTVSERPYKCIDRCVGGTVNFDGKLGEASEWNEYKKTNLKITVDTVDSKFPPPYTGKITRAQQQAIIAEFQKTLVYNVTGEVVMMGFASPSLFQSIEEQLKWFKTGEFRYYADTGKKVAVFDTFKGYETCHRHHDTGLCPAFGSGAESIDTMGSNIRESEVGSSLMKLPAYEKITKLPTKISFAYVSGNLYSMTLSMLRAILPRLSVGGTVMVQNFGWEGFPGVEQATKEIVKELKSVADAELDINVYCDKSGGYACYIGGVSKRSQDDDRMKTYYSDYIKALGTSTTATTTVAPPKPPAEKSMSKFALQSPELQQKWETSVQKSKAEAESVSEDAKKVSIRPVTTTAAPATTATTATTTTATTTTTTTTTATTTKGKSWFR